MGTSPSYVITHVILLLSYVLTISLPVRVGHDNRVVLSSHVGLHALSQSCPSREDMLPGLGKKKLRRM